LVVGGNEIHKSLHEFLSPPEDPAPHDFPGEDAEPDFDLVEPTGMGGSKGEMEPFLFGNPGQSFLAAMGRPIVGDEVKLLVGIIPEKPAEEANKGLAVVAGPGIGCLRTNSGDHLWFAGGGSGFFLASIRHPLPAR